MKKITRVKQIEEGEWYWIDKKTPCKAVKRGRWVYFIACHWISPQCAGRVLKTHEVHGAIPRP